MPVRLAHFSDIHLTSRRLGWTVRDVFGKRTTGWVNVNLLGRGGRFRHAPSVVDVLRRDLATRRLDHLVFSGDATMLGFDTEMAAAAMALGVGDAALPPAIAVPGNHDVYVSADGAARRVRGRVRSWQEGQRVGSAIYPFAQKVGHVWLIGLNSAKSNFWMWDATGKVGEKQLGRFRELCAGLGEGPRIVVSHYPILTKKRIPEPRFHRLRDWERVRDDGRGMRHQSLAAWPSPRLVCVAGGREPTVRNHLCRQFDADKEVGLPRVHNRRSETDGPAAHLQPRDQCVPGS